MKCQETMTERAITVQCMAAQGMVACVGRDRKARGIKEAKKMWRRGHSLPANG